MSRLFFKRNYLNTLLAMIAVLLLAVWMSKGVIPQFLDGANADEPLLFPFAHNIALSNDGQLGLFIPKDQNPELWDMTTHQPIIELIQNKETIKPVEFAIFSENKHFIATISGDTFGIWDLQAKKQIYYFSLPQAITRFCLNNDGNTAVIALKNNDIQTINLATRKLISNYKATFPIISLTCDQTLSSALIGLENGNTLLWDVGTGNIKHQWNFDEGINLGQISPLGHYAILSAGPYESHVWRLDTFEPLFSLHRRNKYLKFTYKELLMLTTASFSPDEKYFAVATPSGLIQLWNIAKEKPVEKWTYPRNRGWPPHANFAVMLGVNENISQLTSVSNTGQVNFWNFE